MTQSMPLMVKLSELATEAECSILGGRAGKYVETRYGNFRCVDKYTILQFAPWWERRLKEEVARCKGLFVDIGANAGLYTVIAAKHGNPVISVEPYGQAYLTLVNNIHLNQLSNVKTLQVAAWDRQEPLKLSENRDSGFNSIGESGSYEVTGAPIDYYLEGLHPALIKIDTERTESRVLEGLRKTLTSCSPKVIFEAWDKRDLDSCMEVLRSCGYRTTGKLGRIIWVAEKA